MMALSDIPAFCILKIFALAGVQKPQPDIDIGQLTVSLHAPQRQAMCDATRFTSLLSICGVCANPETASRAAQTNRTLFLDSDISIGDADHLGTRILPRDFTRHECDQCAEDQH